MRYVRIVESVLYCLHLFFCVVQFHACTNKFRRCTVQIGFNVIRLTVFHGWRAIWSFVSHCFPRSSWSYIFVLLCCCILFFALFFLFCIWEIVVLQTFFEGPSSSTSAWCMMPTWGSSNQMRKLQHICNYCATWVQASAILQCDMRKDREDSVNVETEP